MKRKSTMDRLIEAVAPAMKPRGGVSIHADPPGKTTFSAPPDALSRRFWLSVDAIGHVFINDRRDESGAFSVYSTDTREQAEALQTYHCRLSKSGPKLYRLNEFRPHEETELIRIAWLFHETASRRGYLRGGGTTLASLVRQLTHAFCRQVPPDQRKSSDDRLLREVEGRLRSLELSVPRPMKGQGRTVLPR